MKNRRTAAILAVSFFAFALRRISDLAKASAPAAANLVLLGFFVMWGWWSAHANTVTTTISGTVALGAVATAATDDVFGYGPGTDLTGKSFSLIYTTNTGAGTGTVVGGVPPTSSYIEYTTTSNPITMQFTVGGGSEYLGFQPISLISSGTYAKQSATSSGTTQYAIGESNYLGFYTGSDAASANIYFSTPAYNANYLWCQAYSYSPGSGGLTNASGSYAQGYDDGVDTFWERDTNDMTLTVSSITVSGCTGTNPSPPGTGVNQVNNGCAGCNGQTAAASPAALLASGAANYTPVPTALQPMQPNPQNGDPVNAATGNQFTREIDFIGPAHTQLSFVRYYNSYSQANAGLGVGWTSTYHHGLSKTTSTSVTVTRADGRQDVFSLTGTSNWTPQTNVTSALAEVTSGSTQTGWALTLPDDSVESYTLGGQLSAIKTRAGLTTSLGYTSSLLTTVTGPFGHALTMTNTNGLLSTLKTTSGNEFQYFYDQNGNLSYVQEPNSYLRRYYYFNPSFPNLMTALADEGGKVYASWTYDGTGRALTSQLAGGAQLLTLSYTSTGVTTATDALGNSTSYSLTTNSGFIQPSAVNGTPLPAAGGSAVTYDANGFVSGITDFDGNVTKYTHNSAGEETSRTEAFGTALARTTTTKWSTSFHLPTEIDAPLSLTTTYGYDSHGNLLKASITDGTHTRVWSYTYNSNGQVLGATDPLSHTTTYSYDASGDVATMADALGHTTTFNTYDADGRLLSMTDANNLTTTYSYDSLGRVLTRDVGGLTTTIVYSPGANQPATVTFPDSSSFTYTYDDAHRLTLMKDVAGDSIAASYDAASDLTQVLVHDPSSNLKYQHSYSYTIPGRLAYDTGAALGETTTYSYDNNGNVLGIVDPLGHTTTYGYDALNRRITGKDALGKTTTLTFNALDQLTMVKDPLGLTTTYSYDGLGDTLGISSPDSGVSSYTYDAAGNLLTGKDALSQTTTYTYDALNRALGVTYTGSSANISYLYDTGTGAVGHLTRMSDLAATTTWTYDKYGRVLTKKQTTGTVALTTTYAYDSYGRVYSMEYPSTKTVYYDYDGSGRITDLYTDAYSFSYFPFGPVTNLTLNNTTTESRTIDQDGRITGIGLGNTTTANTQTLTYDNASRITQLAETGLTAKTYGYDNDDRLTSFFNGTATGTYSYDANGNRLSYALGGTTTYNHTANTNRLSSLTGTTTATYTINADGNMTSDGVHTWAYDQRGRAISETTSGTTISYGINGFGQRVSKSGTGVPNGGTNEYVYDEQGHLIGEYGSTGTIVNETEWIPNTPVSVYSRGNGIAAWTMDAMPVAMLTGASGGTINPITADWLNTPHIIANSSKQDIWTLDHYAFGDNAPNQNPYGVGTFVYNWGLPGQYRDVETGTFYNYMRDNYFSSLGLYGQSDPLGMAGTSLSGRSLFPYVGGNPMTRIDPDGRNWILFAITAAGAVTGAYVEGYKAYKCGLRGEALAAALARGALAGGTGSFVGVYVGAKSVPFVGGAAGYLTYEIVNQLAAGRDVEIGSSAWNAIWAGVQVQLTTLILPPVNGGWNFNPLTSSRSFGPKAIQLYSGELGAHVNEAGKGTLDDDCPRTCPAQN